MAHFADVHNLPIRTRAVSAIAELLVEQWRACGGHE